MSRIEEMIRELCPNGVECVRLGDICKIVGRIGFRGYTRNDLVEKSEGAISLSPANIVNEQLNFEKCTYISWAKYKESPEIMIKEGDIIFCKTASVGKTALVRYLPKEATINPQLVVLKNIKTNSAYLSYVLKSRDFQNQVNKIKGVGSVPTFTQRDFANLLIPVPPLAIQNEIVYILDKFTELEAELEAELEERRKQHEYYRNKLLTFNEITPPLKNEVKWLAMSEVFEIKNGYTPSKAKHEYWTNGTIPWFRMEDIRMNGRVLSDSIQHITPAAVKSGRLFPANSIILATTATIGEHALIITDSLANQRFTNLSIRKSHVKELDMKFFFYYMFIVDEWCKNNTNTSGFESVDMVKFKKLLVPIPPMEEQQRIVSILDKFETLVNDISEGLPAEIAARRQQYEYYRDKLLTFKRIEDGKIQSCS